MGSAVKRRLRILITNDDGIAAPGIHHLRAAVSSFADVVMVAPAVEQSSVGLSITVRAPLRLEQVDKAVWTVSGTPADSVKLALSVVMKDALPDLILSGINKGTNSGKNILYSGTVAGVIEGLLHEIPGVAFSCVGANYHLAEKHIPKVVEYVASHPLPAGTFLNINFPEQEMQDFKMVRQGRGFWTESPNPAPQSCYWLGSKLATFEEEDSDVHWLNEGYATAVPIHIAELTDKEHLQENKKRFEAYF
ncbi:MAG: 5'/3'-nucleotidase SurE [Verrucomicrobia bacterium]|nr:5'/3'-nucleotidase SurE [Verrucomicrobiota bacterium]MBS0635985.1 5'/3'-nucleotidase SurE [Verrucomicrobiota bacterium]